MNTMTMNTVWQWTPWAWSSLWSNHHPMPLLAGEVAPALDDSIVLSWILYLQFHFQEYVWNSREWMWSEHAISYAYKVIITVRFFTFWVSQLEPDPNPCSKICVPNVFYLIINWMWIKLKIPTSPISLLGIDITPWPTCENAKCKKFTSTKLTNSPRGTFWWLSSQTCCKLWPGTSNSGLNWLYLWK